MSPHQRFVKLFALTLVLLPVAASAAAPAPGTLFLHPERIDLGDGGFVEAERGMLFVPVRRGVPESGVLGVEVYRFRATAATVAPEARAATNVPPVFLLHGGPGWPGFGDSLEEPGYYDERIRPFLAVADLVVVGQRGIGSSKPDTACEPPAEPAPDEVASAEELAATMRGASARCRDFWEERGLDLAGFTVVEAAADVDDVRKALGYEKIVLWGGSFGSHWSLAVMRFHPRIVERAVLRGLEGPDHTYDMPGHVLHAIEKIAAAAESSPELRPLLPEEGLVAAFRGVVARAEEEAIEVRLRDGENGEPRTVRFDAEDVRRMVMGYTGSARSRGRLPRWPAEILELVAGDFRQAARRELDGGGGFPTASFFLLDCGSGISRARRAELEADPAVTTVGHIGSFYQWTCPAWESDLGEGFRKNFRTDIPTLLVHGNWDLSTPLENALDLAPFFTRGKLVVVEGGTHGALREAMAESESFRAAVMGFVRTGDAGAVPSKVELEPIVWEVPERRAEERAAELLEVALAYLQAVYVDMGSELIGSFFTEESVWEDPTMAYFGEPRRIVGRDAIVELYRQANQDGAAETSFAVESSFVTGERVMLDLVYTTTADGEPVGYPGLEVSVTIRAFTILEIRDGKVVHHLDHVDYPDMMRQVRAQARAAEILAST